MSTAFHSCLYAKSTALVTGVVIPSIRKEFNIGFTLASVLFLTCSAGQVLHIVTEFLSSFLRYTGATLIIQPLNECFSRFSLNATNRISILRYILDRNPKLGHSPSLGRCSNLLLFGILHCAFFSIIAATPTFSPVLVAFFLGGIGKSVLIGQLFPYQCPSLSNPLRQPKCTYWTFNSYLC